MNHSDGEQGLSSRSSQPRGEYRSDMGLGNMLLRMMSKTVLPVFSSRSLMVLGLTFKSLIHFELIFVHGEMTDDLDHYTNSYQIYSKDPKNCPEFLGLPEVINWKQHLQIQSSQSSLDEVIENLVAIKLGKVKRTQCLLYMVSETTKKLVHSMQDSKNLSPNGDNHKSINQKTLKLSSLDVTHAALVNKFWSFGGNERSQRFIERCIQTFPTFCLLGPEGNPVSWCLMDQTGEIRMGGTVPEYRDQGLVSQVICAQIRAMDKLGFPMYSHVDRANHIMQRVNFNLKSISLPCDWNQWNCVPL
ncbi:glycine N-acyltransferase-like isoform X1 [Equus asinus]|uniref:glycine N-acyltransferase-like isoform X1 n=2 Tax=Equus asinus TaxID=9793 RepID=UPI0038F6EC0D